MKSRMSLVLIAVLLSSVLALFSGCGQQITPTLEDIVASDSSLAKAINDEIEKPKGMKADVTFSGDTFDVVYTFDEKHDTDEQKALVKAFDSNAEGLNQKWEAAIDNLETQTDISGIIGTISIKNAAGDEIWTKSYPEEEK